MVRSPAATAGGAGNATPPRRPAEMAVGAGVRLGLGSMGSGLVLAGRRRGRHLGRTATERNKRPAAVTGRLTQELSSCHVALQQPRRLPQDLCPLA